MGTLLNALLERARAIPDLTQVQLGVSAKQAAAKRLYESLGFECFGREPDALVVDGKLFDQDHMLLRITR